MYTRAGVTSAKLGRRWYGPFLVMGLLAIVAPVTPAIAQLEVEALTPREDLYKIRLTDGSVLFGRVTAVKGETIVLVTLVGARLEVECSQIRMVREATTTDG